MTSSSGEPEPHVSPATLYLFTGFLSALSVVGTGGNALVLYVFCKKRDSLVSTLFILTLAVVDFLTCLIIVPCTVYMEYVDFHVQLDSFCRIYQFLITSSIPFSTMIMVAIAVDRYLCICHPLLSLMTIRRAKYLVLLLALISIGLGLCVSLMFTVYATVQRQPNNNSSNEFNLTPGSLILSNTALTTPSDYDSLPQQGLNSKRNDHKDREIAYAIVSNKDKSTLLTTNITSYQGQAQDRIVSSHTISEKPNLKYENGFDVFWKDYILPSQAYTYSVVDVEQDETGGLDKNFFTTSGSFDI